MQYGDRIFFFHNALRHRKVNKLLSSLVVNDCVITDKLVINDHEVNFYTDLFNEGSISQVLDDSDLLLLQIMKNSLGCLHWRKF